MKLTPTPAAYQLMHEGAIALSDVEHHGLRIDKDYLERMLAETLIRIKELEAELRADAVYRIWQRRYGEKTNIGSPDQLARVVYEEMGLKPKFATEGGERGSASKHALESIDLPFLKMYFRAAELRKAHGTYLGGIKSEMVQHDDGCWYVHPSFNLHTVETYRSSSNQPNVQNIPVRDPAIAEIIRRCYVARPGHQILEIDYGQMEARTPCAYSFDPVLIEYMSDISKDMHRDMAAQVYILPVDTIKKMKPLRNVTKAEYVFATLYGSYYCQTAPKLWDMAVNMQMPSGITVGAHLAEKGITELGECDPKERASSGTFEEHVKTVEDDFWGRRFKVHAQWKRDWYAAYLENGGCQFLTGFVMRGAHAKNDITNYAIQGSSFHCLLWALIRINRRLKRYKFRTRMINEVHDSIQFDCWPPERDDVIDISVSVMTEEIKKYAPWLNVPLVAEPEACPIDGSWFEKASLVSKGGTWIPSDEEKWTKAYGPWDRQGVA